MDYPITFWYGIRKPFLSRERLIEARDAGFNVIECSYDTQTNLWVLSMCRELGLKANVSDDRMYHALSGEEGWQASLDGIIADYKDCPALNRFFVRDEPTERDFDAIGRVVSYMHEHDPAHGEYINLLPLPAILPYDNYERHVNEYLEAVKPTLLSYDHYNLMYREVPAGAPMPEEIADLSDENRQRNGWVGKVYEAWDREGYYDNIELIRRKARDAGIPWMTIILLVEHWVYRRPSESEMRREAFNALTYGSCSLSYFTYWTPGTGHSEPWSYHHGIILSDGTKGEKYAIVREINRELQLLYKGITQMPHPGLPDSPDARPVADICTSSEVVYHIGSEQDPTVKPFEPFGPVRSVRAESLVVGLFAGRRMMLTNKLHRAEQPVFIQSDEPLFILDKQTGCFVAFDGNLTLAPGDGALIAY